MEKTYPADDQRMKSPEKTKPRSKSQDKPDRRLQDLEKLHQGTNVKASIQLQEGRRIKLDDGKPGSGNKKVKQPPNVNMNFSNLQAGQPVTRLDKFEAAHSDDDLPDAQDIFSYFGRKQEAQSAKAASSSETRYSDPEVDNFILNTRSPARGGRSATAKPSNHDQIDLTMSSPPPVTPHLPRKRHEDPSIESRILKKPKLSDQPEPMQVRTQDLRR